MLVVKLKGIEHKSCYNSQASYVIDDEYIIDTEKDSYAIPLEDIESIDVVEDKQYNLYQTEWKNWYISGHIDVEESNIIKEVKYLTQFLEFVNIKYEIIKREETISGVFYNTTETLKYIRIPIIGMSYRIVDDKILDYDIRDIKLKVLKAKENINA